MPPNDWERLSHMLEAAEKAVEIVGGKTSDQLEDDELRILALTHLLELIGEAASGISAETREGHASIPWAKMVATRNRLIHGYFDIDLSLVWRITTEDLPPLIEALRQLDLEQPQ